MDIVGLVTKSFVFRIMYGMTTQNTDDIVLGLELQEPSYVHRTEPRETRPSGRHQTTTDVIIEPQVFVLMLLQGRIQYFWLGAVASQPINWAGQSPGAPKVLGAPSNFADFEKKTQNHKYNNDMYESSISWHIK